MIINKKIKAAVLLLIPCLTMTGCSVLLKDQPINQKTISDESMLASDMIYVWHSNNGKSLETVIKEQQDKAFHSDDKKATEQANNSNNTEVMDDTTEMSTETPLENNYTFTKAFYSEEDSGFSQYDTFDNGMTRDDQVMWIKAEEEDQIPTLYANDALVFYSEESLPMEFSFARFKNMGYTFGIAGLKIEENGKCTYDLSSKLLMNSSREGKLANLKAEKIVFKSIGGHTLTQNDLDEYGAVKGLKKGATYDVVVYKGTIRYTTSYVADNKMLVYGGQAFSVENFDLLNNNTAVIKIPESCESGYYFVNQIGMVRYIAPEDEDKKIKDIDFNAGIDEYMEEFRTDNETVGNEELTEAESTESESSTQIDSAATSNAENNENVSQIYEYNVPENAEELSINIVYTDAESENSDFQSAPFVVVIDPNGNEVQRFESSGNFINGQIPQPITGTYKFCIYNLDGRRCESTFDVH